MEREQLILDLARDLIKMIAKVHDEMEELKKQVEELERDIICLKEK